MSTAAVTSENKGGNGEKTNYLNVSSGIKSWLLTLDHKRIGILYLWTIMLMFFFAGMLAMLMRLELLAPGADMMASKTYNQLFTLHGAVMIFMFIVPGVPAILGNFALPIMIGAKDVAFPRLNLASWYVYIIGSALAVYSIIAGSVDTGWTFYTPYSTQTSGAVISMIMAIFILGFSSVFTGLNFIATVHKLRAPGMTWFKMPLFVWGLYATGIIQVLATPVLGITVVLLALERAFGIGIFDPSMGGDPVLFQHFFWFYSHPAVYIMILPGMGIISEMVSTFSHRKIFGYKLIAYSSIAIAFLSFGVWGHHMFVSGQSEYSTLIFSFLTFLVAIPSGIKMFNWVATMFRGSITFETPMLFTLAFFFTFAIGGLTGIFLGATSVDVHLTDTYFIVAHFHYVMMGGTVMAMFGGLFYWWPKIWGRLYNEAWGQMSAAMIFLGFNLTFFPQFIMGTQGMPRRYFTYPDQYQILHVISTAGSWVLFLGLLIMAVTLIVAMKWGPKAGRNPWGSLTLEWMIDSPPPPHNFEDKPKITHGPYDHDKVLVKPDKLGASA
jgi:cytochrome c oxidase subunit 1